MARVVVLRGDNRRVRCDTQILRSWKVARHGRLVVFRTANLAPMNPRSSREETLTALQASAHAMRPHGQITAHSRSFSPGKYRLGHVTRTLMSGDSSGHGRVQVQLRPIEEAATNLVPLQSVYHSPRLQKLAEVHSKSCCRRRRPEWTAPFVRVDLRQMRQFDCLSQWYPRRTKLA